jgi:hypothetical protein
MFEKSDYTFVGKHGEIISKLTHEIDENSKFSIFKRNVDVLFIAPIVGYLWNRRSEKDNGSVDSDDNKKINYQQLQANKDIINTNYQIIMLLHDKDKVDSEERINRAFRYGKNDPERLECDKIYESYILGGLEVLKEKLLDNAVIVDDYIKNMYTFINEYHERKENESLDVNDIINKFLN